MLPPLETGYVLIKQDAFADDCVCGIEELIFVTHGLESQRSQEVDLSLPDILRIYEPDDALERVRGIKCDPYLRTLGALSMVGTNKILEVGVPGACDWDGVVARLKAIRGKGTDDPTAGTVRGVFPSLPKGQSEALDYWQRAPLIVRNRIHTPDTQEAAAVLRDMLQANSRTATLT